jgi:hypothetical protein
MEQNLRFGLVLGRLVVLKTTVENNLKNAIFEGNFLGFHLWQYWLGSFKGGIQN